MEFLKLSPLRVVDQAEQPLFVVGLAEVAAQVSQRVAIMCRAAVGVAEVVVRDGALGGRQVYLVGAGQKVAEGLVDDAPAPVGRMLKDALPAEQPAANGLCRCGEVVAEPEQQ